MGRLHLFRSRRAPRPCVLPRRRTLAVERLEDRCLLSIGDYYGSDAGVTLLADNFNDGSLASLSGLPDAGIANLWSVQRSDPACSAAEAEGRWTLLAAGDGASDPRVTVASTLRSELDIFRTKEEPVSFVGTRLEFHGSADADAQALRFALVSQAGAAPLAADDAFGFEVSAVGDVLIFAKNDTPGAWSVLLSQADALPVAPTGFCLTLGAEYPPGETVEVGWYTLELYWNGGRRVFAGAHGLSETAWDATSGANRAAIAVELSRAGPGATSAEVRIDALYVVRDADFGRYDDSSRELTTIINQFLPPYVLANGHEENPYVKAGYLPVTLYGAAPDDGIDDTAPIQQAIDDARRHSLVCFFPAGVYDLSGPLAAVQQAFYGKVNAKWKGAGDRPNMLVGSTLGARPVLRLADNTFNATETALLTFTSEKTDSQWPYPAHTPPIGTDQPNMDFQQLLRGIDIDLGTGNTKAVGVQIASAQGTTVEDVKIYGDTDPATTFYAGLKGAATHDGGWFNVEVVGGHYGLLMASISGAPPEALVTGAVLRQQQTAAIYLHNDFFTLVAVGLQIEKAGGTAILLGTSTWFDSGTTLNLVDCAVTMQDGGTLLSNVNQRNLYLRNVYGYNATTLVDNGAGGSLAGAAGQWRRIDQFSLDIPPGSLPYGRASNSVHVVNGVMSNGQTALLDNAPGAPPPDLVARHLWGGDFPSFEDPDAVNVVEASRTWAGPRVWADGKHDDRPGLQYAVDHHDKVFLPKGLYAISGTLVLGEHTRFFGVPRPLTIIVPDIDTWNPIVETPLLTTVDSAEADTVLAYVTFATYNAQVLADRTALNHFAVEWRAGRDSILRDLRTKVIEPLGHTTYDADWTVSGNFQFTGNGGGRAYTAVNSMGVRIAVQWAGLGLPEQYRTVRISGTHEPLSIYALNPEDVLGVEYAHARARYKSEIVNAQNVQVFGSKDEQSPIPAIHIENSDNVLVVGHADNIAEDSLATPFHSVEMIQCDNTTLAGIFRNHHPSNPSTMLVHEDYGGAVTNVLYDNNVSLAQRGSFQSVFDQVSGMVRLDGSLGPAGAGVTVRLLVNGAAAGTGQTLAGGRYALRPTVRIRPGDELQVRVDDATLHGTAGVLTDGGVQWHLDLLATACNLDADGNGAADALSDGILILRYLFDPAGAWNAGEALGSGATRTDRAAIKAFLDGGQGTLLDADGNGNADPLSDGILILRYLFDPGGAWSIDDALGAGATRTSREAIRAYLDEFTPALPATPAAAPADSVRLATLVGAALAMADSGVSPGENGLLTPIGKTATPIDIDREGV